MAEGRLPLPRSESRDEGGATPYQGEGGVRALLSRLLREAFGKRLWIGASLTYGEDMRGGLARRVSACALCRRASDCDQRRADAYARAAHARRRPHLYPRENHARGRRAPHASQRRAPSQSSTRNGAAVRRSAEAVAETIRFLDGLAFSLDELKHCYPEELREGHATPQEALEAFVWEGAETRYPDGVPERTREALKYELALIASLDYAPYFLTVHDIVRFARSKGNPLSGPRLGSQFRRLLLPSDH